MRLRCPRALASVIAMSALVACGGSDGQASIARTVPTSAEPASTGVGGALQRGGSPAPLTPLLVYAEPTPEQGSRLLSRPLQEPGPTRVLLDVPPNESFGFVRPGEDVMPYRVRDRRPDIGAEHFTAEPLLTLFNPDGTTAAVFDRTSSLELSPDRTRLAWLRQTRIQTCTIDEPGCEEPPVHVGVSPLTDLAERRTWGPFQGVRYALWIGDESLVLVQRSGGARLLDTTTGRTQSIGLQGGVVGVSPGSRRIISLSDDLRTVYVTSLDSDEVMERSYPDQRIDVATAPRGDALLLSLTDPPVEGTARSHMRLLDVGTGAETVIAEPDEDGELLWSDDGEWFGYRRIRDGMSFEYRVCARVTPDVCRTVLSWESETDILAI